jgi:predicted AAA+ superfamily ATPase
MADGAGEAMLRSLYEHNPWWREGADAFEESPYRRDVYEEVVGGDDADSRFFESPVVALVGRSGVGKTPVVHEFVRRRIARGDAPERFLYLPFDADPLSQLRSDEQLRAAVRYYESRVVGGTDTAEPSVVLVDEAHRIEHPNKPQVEGWGTQVADLLDRDYHVVVTASAVVQVDRELDRAGVPAADRDVQAVLPAKFRVHLRRALDGDGDGPAASVRPEAVHSGPASLPAALQREDADRFVEGLRTQCARFDPVRRRVETQVAEYLALGGILGYDRDGTVASAADLDASDFDALRRSVRDVLYQEVPGFESIETIPDLERLCALAASDCGREPFRYQDLADLFDVDRRTIADSYLPPLRELYLLVGVTEYDNSRPRAVRLYLRDTALVTALGHRDPAGLRTDFARETDLARVAAFDHTKRFCYHLNAAQGRDRPPVVTYWDGAAGDVDFVFEVGDAPVPVGLAYRAGERDDTLAALREFRDAHDAPLGLLVTGDTSDRTRPVSRHGTGVVELPYWLYLLVA